MALYKKYTDLETRQISKISHDITRKYGTPKINHICVIIDHILYESPSIYNKKNITIGTLENMFLKKNMSDKTIIETRAIISKHEPIIDRIINKLNPPNLELHSHTKRCSCSCIIL